MLQGSASSHKINQNWGNATVIESVIIEIQLFHELLSYKMLAMV